MVIIDNYSLCYRIGSVAERATSLDAKEGSLEKSTIPGIKIEMPPGYNQETTQGHQRVWCRITIPRGGYFPGHYHPPPNGDFKDPGEVEIYRWGSGEMLIFLRPPGGNGPWRRRKLNRRRPLVAIEPGWQHAGIVVGGESAVFTAYTCANHLPGHPKANIKMLSSDKLPMLVNLTIDAC